jgi:hypothetical protein
MAAARDFFDAKVDLKKFARRAQHAQSLIEDFGPNAVTGQGNDVIGFFCHVL